MEGHGQLALHAPKPQGTDTQTPTRSRDERHEGAAAAAAAQLSFVVHRRQLTQRRKVKPHAVILQTRGRAVLSENLH